MFFKKVSEPYPWSFIAYIIIVNLIPTFYQLSNTYWIGHISNASLAISEQYEFLSVAIEIVNETIPFGVLALVAQNYKNREKVISILKSGLTIQILFSTALTLITVFFTPQFVSAIGTPPEIVSLTTNYLLLQAIALPFNAVSTLLIITIKSLRRGREALYLVLISVIVNMICDLFLISNTSLSLHMGVQGSAIGYVISQATLATITSIFTIKILHLNWHSFLLPKWRNMVRPLFSIGGWTGLDSLVRNIGYILVPLNVLNVIGTNPYGGYELAMTVMWTLIIPVLAITEATNVVVGNYYGERRNEDLKKVIITSLFLVTIVMVAIATGGIFLWEGLSSFFNMNPTMVYYSTLTFWWLIIPYCLFALDGVLKSIFFGTGKTKYIFIVSSIVNFGLIIPFWILTRLGLLEASFNNVMLLFVIVFALDLAISYFFVRRLLNRMKISSI